MSQNTQKKKIISNRKMSRQEIIEAVTDPDSVMILGKDSSKTIAIPTASSTKADLDRLVNEMDAPHDSLKIKVIRLFCEEKKASDINTKVFIMRIKNLNKEQLKVVGRLCSKKEFTATNILKAIQSIRRFDASRLLSLRAFVDLEGMGPGPLNQFFNTTLPQSNRKEVGQEAFESEVREKLMTPAQNTAFYNICYQIKGIEPSDAIAILRKVRKLKAQHTEVINTFLRKGAVFGDDSINKENVLKLINLWLTLPELSLEKKLKKFIKRMSKRFKKQPDFKYIVQSFIKEKINEKSKGRFWSFILRIFS